MNRVCMIYIYLSTVHLESKKGRKHYLKCNLRTHWLTFDDDFAFNWVKISTEFFWGESAQKKLGFSAFGTHLYNTEDLGTYGPPQSNQ